MNISGDFFLETPILNHIYASFRQTSNHADLAVEAK